VILPSPRRVCYEEMIPRKHRGNKSISHIESSEKQSNALSPSPSSDI
jgi:hypothetical protein